MLDSLPFAALFVPIFASEGLKLHNRKGF